MAISFKKTNLNQGLSFTKKGFSDFFNIIKFYFVESY